MTVSKEVDLRTFDFWGGARAVANLVQYHEFAIIENYMEEVCDIWTETEDNDFFWFDDEVIAELLGYVSFDEMWEDRIEKEEDV